MKYLELKIIMDKEILPEVSEALAASGFNEMIINDPTDFLEIEEHPEWYKYDYINEELKDHVNESPEITIYFSYDEKGRKDAGRAENVLKELKQIINKQKMPPPDTDDGLSEDSRDADGMGANESGASGRSAGALKWTVRETADDSEWLYKWQEHFKPTKVGEHIVVKPSWEEYEAKPGELVIEIDPGMAFGSGLHETTTLCIKALEKMAEEKRIKVLDVGCGTGILSIAAAMLGADECLGIDIDADAVRIARENIERNGLSEIIKAIEGDLIAGVDFKPDIIVANLMADLVERLAPAAAEHLRRGGIFISSGILDVKCDRVADAVRDAGFEIRDISADGEWRAITAIRV